MRTDSALLAELDRYFDLAPRSDATAESTGPFTVFVGRGAWSYYARPRRGFAGDVTARDIAALGEHCARCGIDLSIEWVGEITPSLQAAALEAGLAVTRHALLAIVPNELAPVDPPQGIKVELLAGSDARLRDARAVAEVAFGAPGTATGRKGSFERDEQIAALSEAMCSHLAWRSTSELTVTAVASDENGVLASGSLQPAGDAGEILAVATLPAARRRGLAAAVTTALVREAEPRRLERLLLSAESEDVARVYERVGFCRVGTHLAAERDTD